MSKEKICQHCQETIDAYPMLRIGDVFFHTDFVPPYSRGKDEEIMCEKKYKDCNTAAIMWCAKSKTPFSLIQDPDFVGAYTPSRFHIKQSGSDRKI